MDPHRAPLDGAAGSVVGAIAELERERPRRKLAVIHFGRDDSVHFDGHFRTPRVDFQRVPFTSGFIRVGNRHLREIDDRSRSIFLTGALVVDIYFIGIIGADFLGIGDADEDAAVGGGISPELGIDLEILIGVFRDELPAFAFIRHDDTALGAPVRIAYPVKVFESSVAVNQGDPARPRMRGAAENGERNDQQYGYNRYCLLYTSDAADERSSV